MELKWIATAALAVALIPCAASAQSKTNADTEQGEPDRSTRHRHFDIDGLK